MNKLNNFELERCSLNALKGGNNCGNCVCACHGGEAVYSSTPIATHINTATAYVPRVRG